MGNDNFSEKTGGMHSEGSTAKADRQLITATADGWVTGEDQNRTEGIIPAKLPPCPQAAGLWCPVLSPTCRARFSSYRTDSIYIGPSDPRPLRCAHRLAPARDKDTCTGRAALRIGPL